MKRLFSFFLSLALGFLLSSCHAAPSSQSGSRGFSSPSAEFGSSVDAEYFLNSSTQPYVTAAIPDLGICHSGNSKGFYEIPYLKPEVRNNILYTDYASGKQSYLCTAPSCGHSTSACSSWIDPDEYCFPIAMEDKLILVYSSELAANSRIEVSSLDGSDRKIVFRFRDDTRIGNGAAVNGNCILLFIGVVGQDANGNRSVSQRIRLFDLENRLFADIFTASSESTNSTYEYYENLFFRGTTETGFVIKTISVEDYEEDDDPEITVQNAQDATIHRIMEIPYAGGPPKELLTFSDGQCYEEPRGQYLFYLQNNGEEGVSLERLDPATNEKTQIVSDFKTSPLPSNPMGKCRFGDFIISDIVRDKLLINVQTDEYITPNGVLEVVYQRFSVDINTGEMLEISLSSRARAAVFPLFILAQLGDMLLVECVTEEIPFPEEGHAEIYTYAIISMDDFLASRPNFRIIEHV